VFIHTHWTQNRNLSSRGLAEHPDYVPAKEHADIDAAKRVINDIVDEITIDRIVDAVDGRESFVLAPLALPSETNNILPVAYTVFLARELDFTICKNIHQKKNISRDRRGFWERVIMNPEFYGPVHAGKNYVIADDVFTIGGTIAGLRSYIENNGGNVLCATALAHPSGENVDIAPKPSTLAKLRHQHGEPLDSLLRKELGYGLECITEPEAYRFLQCPRTDDIGKGIRRAQNP
jgi:hypothetical protein